MLKQVERFASAYEVTTCGYGPTPPGVARHIRIPDDQPENDLNGRLITLRWYSRAYWSLSAVAWARRALQPGDYDIVLANDVEAVPVALGLRPVSGVLADLHEYTPRLHEEHALWKKRIGPFYDWLCRRYVARATRWTTVSNGLVSEYERQFGFRAELVTNAAPYVDLEPAPVTSPIRLVHSGACLRNRQIMLIVDAVIDAESDVTLDLYLTPNDPGYLDELRQRASGNPRITVRDAVPYSELVRTLNGFDVGVHLLPPVNFNNIWALPNKLFDYVQARLAVVVSPTAEMAAYVEQYGLGLVSDDFTAAGLTAAINRLTPESVAAFKQRSSDSARSLAADKQVDIWERTLADMVGAAQ